MLWNTALILGFRIGEPLWVALQAQYHLEVRSEILEVILMTLDHWETLAWKHKEMYLFDAL